jgi:hypothetical protein
MRSVKEKLVQWLAWKMPKRLVYWAAIRLISAATVNEYADTEVAGLTALEALERWQA